MKTMTEIMIKLSAIWVVVMMIYFLGDVIRITSGDAAKAMTKMNFSQSVWLGIAALMLIPILMVFLNLVLPQSVSRWVNIGVAAFFFLFNLVGLPTYPSMYDKFLIAVSLVFNVTTVWYAWTWV
jgi:hypothetical protein